MSAKNYLKILKGGIILSLSFVLFVFPSLLFPYISSKQIPFNILMELLLAIWLVFIWRYPQYRPKLNWLIYSLFAYLLVILISSIFGVDFNLSFWGDVERMLGFFHIFHFFIFFIILISVFRKWSDWRLLLNFSLLVALIVSLIGLFGDNRHSTIGNTTYVSGYLIFNLFFAAILFFRSKIKWRYLYLLPVIIMLLQFKGMRTSGAIIGLGVGLFICLVLVGFLHRNKKIKISFLSLAAVAVLVISFVFSQQNTAWFQNSFLKNLTSQKVTFQTRLLSWQSAAKAFPEHPILGTGFGNYAIIFDKYFDPVFFSYDKNETYFDRAHNNLIDIASTTGILGLITYLSIFIFVAIYIISLWRQNAWRIDSSEAGKRNLELVLITSLFVAYFIQNLAVFDSFVTYIGLMITLGLVYFLKTKDAFEVDNSSSAANSLKNEKWVLVGVLLIAFLFINQYNLKSWRMLEGVIVGYGQIVSGDIVEGLDSFKNTLKDGPLDRDGRSSLLNLVASNPVILTSLTEDKAKEEFAYLESLALKNLAYNNQDSLFLLQTSQLYDLGSRLFYEDKDLKEKYSSEALKYAEGAIASSPGRIPVYFAKAQALIVKDDINSAIETLEYAVSLNLEYPDTYCRLAPIYEQASRQTDALNAYFSCIDGGAVNKIGGANSLINAAEFLVSNEEYERALVVLERLVQIYDTDPNMWMNLAKLYLLTSGDETKARAAANQAVILDPNFATQAELLFSN